MIRHIFRLIWNRKRRNMLLIGEILLSFIVLFAVASMAVSSFHKYIQPLGFGYENVWVLYPNARSLGTEISTEDARRTLQQVHQVLLDYPEVRQVAWSEFNFPYARGQWITEVGPDIETHLWPVDDAYAEVMNISVVEGRWFSKEDDASTHTPAVIDRDLRRELFGDTAALGKIISDEESEWVVVGVIEDYRYLGDFTNPMCGMFVREPLATTEDPMRIGLMSISDEANMQFQKELITQVGNLTGGWPIRIEPLKDMRKKYVDGHLSDLILPVVIAMFLVLNVALGLFGVLWYSISRRRGEIGLRRALGADPGLISRQILLESVTIASLALAVGLFFAIQAPILDLGGGITPFEYIIAIVLSAVAIYALVSLCAWYPGRLAARVQPATALHED
jgi:putative ABC transport system permease protein